MNAFFIIAGIVYTIIGTLAIAVVSGVYIAVKYFGIVLSFGVLNPKKIEKKENDEAD